MSHISKPTETQGLTVKQLIKLLKKCPLDSFVQISIDKDEMNLESLHFVENCPVSKIVCLQTFKPELVDTDYLSIKVVNQEESFAETRYYDVEGRAY